MKNKIISWVVWVIIWWIIVFWYSSIFTETQNNNSLTNWIWSWRNGWPWTNLDISNMNDEQLENMAERSGITVDELKEKLESWENTRNMREKSNIRSKTNSWSTMTGKILDEKPNNLE